MFQTQFFDLHQTGKMAYNFYCIVIAPAFFIAFLENVAYKYQNYDKRVKNVAIFTADVGFKIFICMVEVSVLLITHLTTT
jgi:hypothetical protein